MSASQVVLCTAPDSDVAARIARTLVDERLCACVNLVPGVRSIYRYAGKVCDDAEVLMVIKTMRERIDALKVRIPTLHPYDVPELIVLEISDGLPTYLDWLRAESAADPQSP